MPHSIFLAQNNGQLYSTLTKPSICSLFESSRFILPRARWKIAPHSPPVNTILTLPRMPPKDECESGAIFYERLRKKAKVDMWCSFSRSSRISWPALVRVTVPYVLEQARCFLTFILIFKLATCPRCSIFEYAFITYNLLYWKFNLSSVVTNSLSLEISFSRLVKSLPCISARL